MSGRVSLSDSVQYLRGVGPARAAEFARLGVVTVGDLIEYVPFRFEHIPKSIAIGSLMADRPATIVGELRQVRRRGTMRRPLLTAKVVDGTGSCRVRWFNASFLNDQLHHGSVVRLSGKIEVDRNLALLTNPRTTVVGDGDPFASDQDRFEPVYRATAQLPSKQIARIIGHVLDDAVPTVVDYVPDAIRSARSLPPRPTALMRVHKPTSADDASTARRRLAYDELLLCQLAVRMARRAAESGPDSEAIVVNEKIDQRIRARFPFALTAGQNTAIVEITADMARTRPMNRLLQGDVGAGKTAVALYAALAAIANRRQVVFLAPTEVLARQHEAKVRTYLAQSRVRIGFLAGSTSRADRRTLLEGLRTGAVDLVIGTHALLEPDVAFHDVGLAIIDEQHKFGVAQRGRLAQKAAAPHRLVLTATPIPRTLAMTIFGDLDVSTIRDGPPGRRPVATRLVPPDRTTAAWAFVQERVAAGEQAFVIYPLVDESDKLQLKAATVEAKRLAESVLADCRVGVLHGRLSAADKAQVMRQFREGDVQVLVSTTVVEVGVDVANATVMVIEQAERFGLSQLHQLRGRVGRGERKSYCLLFTSGNADTARERLHVLCETTDGFRIAEEDLRLRGPGELLGLRQHGLPALRVADLVADIDLLEHARDDAATLLHGDPDLRDPAHRALRDALKDRYADTIDLVDVA